MNIFLKFPVVTPFIALLSAEILKLLICFWKEKKIHWSDFARSGGMPSAHATLVSSLTMTIFLVYGISSIEFALSSVFSVIVLYDAIKLRWEAGKHAKVLNYLIGEKKLEERLGHTFVEMMTGIFLGVGVTFLLVMI
ncbi:divergent PAP2 family protein [Candidatus Peregrinibacteria bacterium]|nr:divergent PAP2 family protein [Candidatus Peregrinibacteria bacterium]